MNISISVTIYVKMFLLFLCILIILVLIHYSQVLASTEVKMLNIFILF